MNKESYSYYKNSYRANKRYRVLKGSDDFGEMLTKAEYDELKDTGMSTKDIVYNQFHFYHKETAKILQQRLTQKGFKVSIKDIQARNYTPEIYESIKKEYHTLRQSKSVKESADIIAYTYYGS